MGTDSLNLAGVIGTWVAAGLAIIALAGVLPYFALRRQSRSNYHRAIVQIDDPLRKYTSTPLGLPAKVFMRAHSIPNLLRPPKVDQIPTVRHVDTFSRELLPEPSTTGWINFLNLLCAYQISTKSGGELKANNIQSFVEIDKNWLLYIGIKDRYAWRYDQGLFTGEPKDQLYASLQNGANWRRPLYGLSGMLAANEQYPHEGNAGDSSRICFRMHPGYHMAKMPEETAADGMSFRMLLFLYLGYIPRSDDSLFDPILPSLRTTNSGVRITIWKFTPISRAFGDLGVGYTKIYRLKKYDLTAEEEAMRQEAGGSNFKVRYFNIPWRGEDGNWIARSDLCVLLKSMLEHRPSAQSFLYPRHTETVFGHPKYLFVALFDNISIDSDLELAEKVLPRATATPTGRADLAATITATLQWRKKTRTRESRSLLKQYCAQYLSLQRHWALAVSPRMKAVSLLYMSDAEFVKFIHSVHAAHPDDEAVLASYLLFNVAENTITVPTETITPTGIKRSFYFEFATVLPGMLAIIKEENDAGKAMYPDIVLACLHAAVIKETWITSIEAEGLSSLYKHLEPTVRIAAQTVLLPYPSDRED